MENSVDGYMLDSDGFASRYDNPEELNPDTRCRGRCQGKGYFPLYMFPRDANGDVLPLKKKECRYDSEERDRNLRAVWFIEHKKAHTLRFRIHMAWKYKDITWLWFDRVCDGWHFIECLDCNGTGKHIPF